MGGSARRLGSASMLPSRATAGIDVATAARARCCLSTDFSKVAVIGLGYIGLPTAALIASRGMRVLGVDTNEEVVKTVASSAIHIAEPDLDGLVQKMVSSGVLTASTTLQPADVFIIAVPTP